MSRRFTTLIPLCTVLLISVPRSGRAQSLWISTEGTHAAAIEIGRPYIDGGRSSGSFRGTATFLTLRFPFPKLHEGQFPLGIQVELPFAHARNYYYFITGFPEDADSGTRSSSQTLLGNPYLGLEWPTRTPGLIWMIGIRLSELGGTDPGESLDEVDRDRREAFWRDSAQTMVLLDYSPPRRGPWDVRLRGGIVSNRCTGVYSWRGMNSTFLRYGIRGKRSLGSILLAGGFCGWVNLALERGLVGDIRSNEQVSLGLGSRLNHFEGLILYRTSPWKRQRSSTRYSLSLLIAVEF